MAQIYTGGNALYGKAKRKRSSGSRSEFAGSLSKKLFYKSGPPAPIINTKTMDRFIGKSLKRRLINEPEQKYIEVSTAGGEINTSFQVYLLNGMVLGDTQATRTGVKVRTTKIEVIGYVLSSATAVGGSDNGKISVFVAKQPNGVAPVLASAAAATAPYSGTGISYPLLKNAQYENEYYIIKDWDYSLDANGGVSGTWQRDTFNFRVEVPIQRVVEFNTGNAGTIADIIKNAFYIGYTGTQAGGAPATNIYWYTRIWYTDM